MTVRKVMWSIIAALLLAPLIAMQFTREVAWTGFDFVAAGALLIGGGLAYEIMVRQVRSPARRRVAGALIVALVRSAS